MHVIAQVGTNFFFQQLELGITTGALYALVALGYTLVYGIIELINFAHGDVFMWSTVISLVVVEQFRFAEGTTGLALVGILIFLIAVGMATSAAINVTIERFAYRRLRKAPRLAPLIAAVGASFLLSTAAQLWRGSSQVPYPQIFPRGSINFGLFTIKYSEVLTLVVAIGLMYALNLFVQQTKLGRAMRATAQDPEAASLMGVDINNTIFIAFLIGGALAGAAGVLYNLNDGYVWFFTGFRFGLVAFTAAVLGGIGNIYGAVLGGFVIGVVQSMTNAYVPNGIAWSDAIVFGILVLVLVVRPSGLLGQQVPDKV